MKLKLTEVEKFQIRESYNHAMCVLQRIKARRLSREELKAMKTLEEAVTGLECFEALVS